MSNLNQNPKNKKNLSGGLTILLIAVGFLAILFLMSNPLTDVVEKKTYSEFIKYVEEGKVDSVTIVGNQIKVYMKKSSESTKADQYKVVIPYIDPELLTYLKQHDVNIEGQEQKDTSSFWWYIIPLGLTILSIFFFMNITKQIGGANNQAFSFGKARARLYVNTSVKFTDVAGIDEAKQELIEVVEYLKNPIKFYSLGAKIPRGVLLEGPPGCGKTLLAKAVAGEAGVPFFSISGSDFVEMFVGVGASRVRDLFNQAKEKAPSIIFIDELDAVGRSRGAGLGGGHDEREQTLNQILVEMDGFETQDSVIVLAATNRADILDRALLRPGRFDRKVYVDLPDLYGRYEILQIHARKVPLTKDVDLFAIARGTPGFSGADLANIINEAAILAARNNLSAVDMHCLEEAKDKVIMGPERKSLVLSDQEKLVTAYHEAGHTLVGALMKNSEPVYKVSIIPRGAALGLTVNIPLDDQHHYSKSYLFDKICILLAGRVAEEYKFNEIFTGAQNDIERATKIAHDMVTKYGMSSLGPLGFGSEKDDVFLGKDLVRERNYSEDTAKKIDSEVHKIIQEAFEITKKLIKENIVKLDLLSQKLVEKESLVASEIYEILGIKDPHKDATIESFKKKYIEKNNHDEEKVSDIDQAK
ncbi:MAG: ATP-dependent metallopeptidase FtsH/Yme1/Tma family protein [Spirochaetales bacterium]|nr:ATP-dependent metallopeptidase FtsH/Yme1/Tma family protein [Spirochaetales bacterium]